MHPCGATAVYSLAEIRETSIELECGIRTLAASSSALGFPAALGAVWRFTGGGGGGCPKPAG